MNKPVLAGALASILMLGCPAADAQQMPKQRSSGAGLAEGNAPFRKAALRGLNWEVAEEPIHIAGPLSFVGTRGLGVFLFATSDGLILLNTGMPSSAPMIEASIRKLGYRPENLKIIINGHAHIDHAGAIAALKERFHASLAVMREDVPAMESGDKNDFRYGNRLVYPAVKVDRVLRNGDTVRLGDVTLTAYLTAGHTRGATTWVTEVTEGGKAYRVVFPDGAGFNPGYRIARHPSYPGINADYRNTLDLLASLKPDIWLAPHNEFYDFAGKRARAKTEGVAAWVDPEGYRKFIAAKRRAFEDEVDREMGATK